MCAGNHTVRGHRTTAHFEKFEHHKETQQLEERNFDVYLQWTTSSGLETGGGERVVANKPTIIHARGGIDQMASRLGMQNIVHHLLGGIREL